MLQKETDHPSQTESHIPGEFVDLLRQRDGAYPLAEKLKAVFPKTFAAENLADSQQKLNAAQRHWEIIGHYYFQQQRYLEAALIFSGLYTQLLAVQESDNKRYHKGMPLVWLGDCYSALGYSVIGFRYWMLALIEDSITDKGVIDPMNRGIYIRVVWSGKLSERELKEYAQQAHKVFTSVPSEAIYPERVLQDLSQNWIVQAPSVSEAGVFIANTKYIHRLLSNLGEGSGKALERLADYLLMCMPGCRTQRRSRSGSTDYDLVCSIDGQDMDFRSEFGRYFECECKDWSKVAGFTTMAKFCRVLDSVKSRFGILFSKKGISGHRTTSHAGRERLKVFQDRGIVIVVIDLEDMKALAEGENFINMLRSKYEEVRLDLYQGRKTKPTSRKVNGGSKGSGETPAPT
jgi:hypothetical protein